MGIELTSVKNIIITYELTTIKKVDRVTFPNLLYPLKEL
jgi:hypothetical protein